MKNKILKKIIILGCVGLSSVLITPVITSCSLFKGNSIVPGLDNSIVPNLDINDFHGSENINGDIRYFNIKEKLPKNIIDNNTIKISYEVYDSSGGGIPVDENGIFICEIKSLYKVAIKLQKDNKTQYLNFIVTTMGYTGENDNIKGDYYAINFPLANKHINSTYNFGIKKINSSKNTNEIKYENDKLKLDYKILNIASNSTVNKDAIITINGRNIKEQNNDFEYLKENENEYVSFKKDGEYKLTLTAKEDKNATSSILINVNSGVNIYSKEEFRKIIASDALRDNTLNIQTNITLEGNPFEETFVIDKPCIINGNKNSIDGSLLEKAKYKNNEDKNKNLAIFNIIDRIFDKHNKDQKYFINNLNIIGNGKYNDINDDRKNAINGFLISEIVEDNNSISNTSNQHDYLIRREDNKKYIISNKTFEYRHAIPDVELRNINIFNTLIGVRAQNVINLELNDVTSKNSFLHNIEINGVRKSKFHNISVGYSGGAPIEIKEDFSKIYVQTLTKYGEHIATEKTQDGKELKLFMPADPYSTITKYNDFGRMIEGKVLKEDGVSQEDINVAIKNTNEGKGNEYLFVAKKHDNKYIDNQTVELSGNFYCDNWTAGNEVYYLKGDGSPDSSSYLIIDLKKQNKDSTKWIDNDEKINYALAIINWGGKNYTNLINNIDSDSFHFQQTNVELWKVVPDAESWGYKEPSKMFVNKP